MDTLRTPESPRIESCQRWRGGRASYRPAREVVDTKTLGVDLVDERTAKEFVCRNHYSRSYPAARLRVGLFRAKGMGRTELCGVAVFSVPMNNASIAKYTSVEQGRGVDLGRFVLLDDVGANAETFFLARAVKLLHAELPEVQAFTSYSDPVPRYTEAGMCVLPGHVGTIYSAYGMSYHGRSASRTQVLARDGTIVSARALSKIRNDERGAAYAYRKLLELGAPRRRSLESNADYVARALKEGPFRKLRHPGCHVYAFPVGRPSFRNYLRTQFMPSLPYPKQIDASYGQSTSARTEP